MAQCHYVIFVFVILFMIYFARGALKWLDLITVTPNKLNNVV